MPIEPHARPFAAATRSKSGSRIRSAAAAAILMLVSSVILMGCRDQAASSQPRPEPSATSSPEPPNPGPASNAQAALTRTPTPTVTPTATATPAYFEGPMIIGYSVLGRPLEVYRFGTGPSQRMIIAGIHGGYEWNTILLADQLITLLIGRPDLIPDDVTLFILRSMNPDGEARGKSANARANENRVDLNRNFPALWRKDSPRQGCWTLLELSPGDTPASEPETLAVMTFLVVEQIEAVISYHSAGLGIFPGGQPPDPDSVGLAEAVAEVSDYPYPPVDTGCQYTGQLIDWASENDIAALDIELTNHQDTDLRQNLRMLEVFLAWTKDDERRETDDGGWDWPADD